LIVEYLPPQKCNILFDIRVDIYLFSTKKIEKLQSDRLSHKKPTKSSLESVQFVAIFEEISIFGKFL